MNVENNIAVNPVPPTSAGQPANRPVLAWLVISQALSLLSLVPWCTIAALSVMVFDAPGSDQMIEPWLFVGTVWLYPLFPILCAIVAWVLYRKRRWRAATIVTSLPPAFVLLALVLFGLALIVNY
jgi:hypothetical protein